MAYTPKHRAERSWTDRAIERIAGDTAAATKMPVPSAGRHRNDLPGRRMVNRA